MTVILLMLPIMNLDFDYLRDNMVIYKEQLVQRDLALCHHR